MCRQRDHDHRLADRVSVERDFAIETHGRGGARGEERGDTLVEILIAVVIIALTVSGLVGGLVETITASAQHRSLVTVDTVLKSFAEAAKYDIQFTPVVGGIPVFTECATKTTYTILGTPSPANAPAGTPVTVFGTGYAAGSLLKLWMNGGDVTSQVQSGGTTDAKGDVALTFNTPNAGNYSIKVSDATGRTATSPNRLAVASPPPVVATSPLASYHVDISALWWWNSVTSTFDPSTGSCGAADMSGIQRITFTATAQDTTSGTLDLVVVKPRTTTPNITSNPSTTFVVGTPGSFTVTATGFPVPTLSESGSLPSGVTFDPTSGVLSGTPAAGTAGTYPITFTATNSAGTASQSFTLTINQAPAITSANSTTFTVGTAGSFTVTATGVPGPTFSESGTLPAGVALNSSSGVLSGTPAAGSGGTYPITITATNSAGTASQSFTLTVNQLPAFTSANTTPFKVGTPGSFTVTASGFPAPTLSESPALPSGLTFNAATGVLSGTSAAGTGGPHAITFAATNTAGTTNQSFTLNINEGPAFTSGTSTTFRVGAPGSFSVNASGFPAPTFSESGALPTGVALSTTGVLSGTPGTTGTYPITITATNSAGTANQSFTLTVGQAPAITSGNATTFTVGSAGSFAVTATGSPAPTFSESGALPAGVSLSTSGVLSGTPAAGTGGTYGITITATNSAGAANQSFTLTVRQAPGFTSATSTTFTVGAPGSFAVTASGFPAPTFSESGALPAGVSLSTSGVLSGTPATGTGGTYHVTITATNSVGTAAQSFTLTVGSPPTITSADHVTFATQTSNSFTVTTSGLPPPSITNSNFAGCTINPGFSSRLTFTDNGNGTASLAGSPNGSDKGTYTLCINASNGVGSPATQQFTLTVR